LIISTLTMEGQIRYMKNRPLGFDKDQKLVIPFPGKQMNNLNDNHIRHLLSDHPAVKSATLSSGVPGGGLDYAGTKGTDLSNSENTRVYHLFADEFFITDFGLEWMTPPLTPEALASGLKNGVIVNETLVSTFGWKTAEEALGQNIHSGNIGEERTIIGVVRDFHFSGLHNPIEPLLLGGYAPGFSMVTLTVDIRALPEILSSLQEKWKTVFPESPFSYYFLDENFDRAYRRDEQVGGIVSLFSLLGILIACIGLLGLAAFTAERRTKEIGIRKVLGGSVFRIICLITKEFSVWVVLANLFAWPAAFWLMTTWLRGFHYRITLSPWFFFSAGLIALLLAWMTVGGQAHKAARTDPVHSLRHE
ncbi:MAG: hypothetical protein MUP70_05725, partial [Candidatus Aminicenantes bacterium]|nr:hypothetical protein [Candidatus Aminicenantes bacterium]